MPIEFPDQSLGGFGSSAKDKLATIRDALRNVSRVIPVRP
jgi:hypothetical protein